MFKVLFWPVPDDMSMTLRKLAQTIYRDIFSIIKKMKISFGQNDAFHILAQNIDCECTLDAPQRGGSNEYTQK